LTELFEYFLTLAVSSLFVGASAVVYVSYTSLQANLEFHALFRDLLSLASQALENGSSLATLPMPDSTITCSQGILSFNSGAASERQGIGASCAFSVNVARGTREILFSAVASQLSLVVL
jgi:hypothetical protein